MLHGGRREAGRTIGVSVLFLGGAVETYGVADPITDIGS